MRLTDDELRAVLERAEEIQRTTRQGEAWNAEVSAVVSAGEEIGLSRDAVQRALAERVGLPAGPPAVGAMVWARSADGQFYLAEVLSSTEMESRVRFLRGGEHQVPLDALRQTPLLPGEKVMVDWPMWGPYQCSVVSYDATRQTVNLTDGWFVKTFGIQEVWVSPPRPARPRRQALAMIIVASGTVGALLGATLMALMVR